MGHIIKHRRGTASNNAIRMLLAITLLTSCARTAPLENKVTWDQSTGTFIWCSGEIKVPLGSIYERDNGIDTLQGHFSATTNHLIVRHDIGGYAGAWASRKDAISFEERIVGGFRVWVAKKNWPDGKGGKTMLFAVTFPDSHCANFYLQSSDIADAAVIDAIAKSFRPKGKVTASPICR